MRTPKEIWILFDVDNGAFPTEGYVWWFTTRQAAEEHKRHQATRRYGAALIGPFKYKGKSAMVAQMISRARKRQREC